MKERKSYVGRLNGIFGIWCDRKPEGLELEKENTFMVPDEGKIFKKKADDTYADIIMVSNGEKVEDYEEVDAPKQEEEPRPEEEEKKEEEKSDKE